MNGLQTRVRDGIGGDWDSTRSPWEGLTRLYDRDPEGFYLLACDGLGDGGDEVAHPLADLAMKVRSAVRGGYRFEQDAQGAEAVVRSRSGRALPVPGRLAASVKQFLLEIDEKKSTDRPGKDYEGRPASEAEVRFKLGEPSEREGSRNRARAKREANPIVFKVRDQDLLGLRTLPPYITHGLNNSAKKTLLAPTAVYRGLNRGSAAPAPLREGWAVCGKPSRAYDDDGRAVPAPPGMLYMVFADSAMHVFDWDWVREDPDEPGHPLNMELRFGNPARETRELVLDLPDDLVPGEFDASKPVLSPTGDCVFCYLKEDPSFAERINEDLTVFYSLSERETITGFKIKNFQRILNEERPRNLKDAPGLNVLIQAALRKTYTNPIHKDVTIKLYEIIIAVLVNVPIPTTTPDPSDLAASIS